MKGLQSKQFSVNTLANKFYIGSTINVGVLKYPNLVFPLFVCKIKALIGLGCCESLVAYLSENLVSHCLISNTF